MKKIINEIVELTIAILENQESLYGKTIRQIANSNDTSDLTKMVKKLYLKFNKVKDGLDVSVFVLINRLINQMDISAFPYVIAGNDLYQENLEKFVTKCLNINPVLLPFYRSEEKLEGNVDENSIKTIKSLVGFYIMDKSEVEGL